MLELFLLGATAMGSLVAGLFFLRFWQETRDSFFVLFAASFIIDALNRSAALFAARPNEADPWRFSIRFISFLLILIAIVRKNSSKEA